MKKLFIIFFAVFIATLSCVIFPLAKSDVDTETVSESTSVPVASQGYSTLQIVIMYCIMFTVISVIGVMFIKTVKKNKLP